MFVAERRGTVFLLLGMMAWVVVAFAVAAVGAAVVGLTAACLRILIGAEAIPSVSPLGYVLSAATGFQATLLLAALRQGRLAGGGNRRVGLGAGPVRRKGTVALLCAATIVWLAAFMFMMNRFPALRDFAKSVAPGGLSDLTGASTVVEVARVVLVAALAPVSEELFFRGWLWEALRRREHTVVATVCLTAIPWLLLHGIDAPGRILFLIPAAVVFSLARHLGGSVRASLATHMTNNGIAILVQSVMMLFSDGG